MRRDSAVASPCGCCAALGVDRFDDLLQAPGQCVAANALVASGFACTSGQRVEKATQMIGTFEQQRSQRAGADQAAVT